MISLFELLFSSFLSFYARQNLFHIQETAKKQPSKSDRIFIFVYKKSAFVENINDKPTGTDMT